MKEKTYNIGIIGCGRMGADFYQALKKHKHWHVIAVCDTDQKRVKNFFPNDSILIRTTDADKIFTNEAIDAVNLCSCAKARPDYIRKAIQHKKHVLCEKPLADTIENELEILCEIEKSPIILTVNLCKRNAWYHNKVKTFVQSGQIGKMGIIRTCHMHPGLMVTEGHQHEGPPFHDCGMHDVDICRWHTESEYADWYAQGVKMWGEQHPWWVQSTGHFENGVYFDIVQGFCYGQMAELKPNNCYLEIIGAYGVAKYHHNYDEVSVELYGTDETIIEKGPYLGKSLPKFIDKFTHALNTGEMTSLPHARDAVIASDISWKMLHDAEQKDPTIISSSSNIEKILEFRKKTGREYGNNF